MKLHILSRLWDSAREASSTGDRILRLQLPLAAGRFNRTTKQTELASIQLTCVNLRESLTRLFVRTHCDLLVFDAGATASVSSMTNPTGADGKRRSQALIRGHGYIPIFVRQEYIFSDAYRKERLGELSQRIRLLRHDYMRHVYAGEYVHARAATERRTSARGAVVPVRPPRSPSPGIGHAI